MNTFKQLNMNGKITLYNMNGQELTSRYYGSKETREWIIDHWQRKIGKTLLKKLYYHIEPNLTYINAECKPAKWEGINRAA
jgi:hypothetical protein